jgi:signal transduction histidine kinase
MIVLLRNKVLIRARYLCLTIIVCFFQHAASAQVDESLTNAELYRLIAQLESNEEYHKAAEAYRIIAERDLSEIENLDRAIKNYIEAQKLYERAGDTARMFQTISDLGRLYSGSEYYMEAITMFDRVKNYAERNRDTLLLARMLQHIGEIHLARHAIIDAVEYLEQASVLNLKLEDTLLSTINQLTISALHGGTELIQELPDSLRLELSKYDSIRYESFLPSIHLHVGMYNMQMGNYKLAIYYFNQGLKIVGHNLFVRRELYKKLGESYEQIADYASAYRTMRDYNGFIDSLNNANISESFEEMFIKYFDYEKERELIEMTRDRNITEFKSRIPKMTSYALFVGTVVLLIVSYIIIRSYQQRLEANQIITKQNEEINVRKITELESNLKIETMSSMLQGQEVERERIARDLHDSLGGLLSTVKLHFDALQAKNPEITDQKEYNKAYNLLDAACSEVRSISNTMQPGALLNLGIVPAINDLVNRIQSEETPHIEFIHYGPLKEIPVGVTLHIFRIVQELVFNCLKHAQAKEVLVQLIRNEEDLEIMVEDDGQGFDTAQAKKGMGTGNIQARVNFLKGEISVHSVIGTGTTTTITIPYTNELAGQESFSNIDPEMF